jgi:hypothetical protein
MRGRTPRECAGSAASALTLIGELFGAAKMQCWASMQAAINLGLCLGGVLAEGRNGYRYLNKPRPVICLRVASIRSGHAGRGRRGR